jgi:hypothetical protein
MMNCMAFLESNFQYRRVSDLYVPGSRCLLCIYIYFLLSIFHSLHVLPNTRITISGIAPVLIDLPFASPVFSQHGSFSLDLDKAIILTRTRRSCAAEPPVSFQGCTPREIQAAELYRNPVSRCFETPDVSLFV